MKKTLFASTAALALMLAYTAPAQADTWSQQEVVRSTSGLVVTDSRGNCVRTHSIGDENECSIGQFTEAPKPVAAPRTELESDERTVYFYFDSTELTPEGKAKLDGVAEKLKNAKDVRSADIVGFADRIGNTDYNRDLSERRAKAVQAYLTQRGYLNTRVAEVRGVGESQSTTPCPENTSREQMINCLSPDRKVEVEVVYTDGQPVAQQNQNNNRNYNR